MGKNNDKTYKKVNKDNNKIDNILGSRDELVADIKDYAKNIAQDAAKEAAAQTESDIMAMIANGDIDSKNKSHYENYHNKFYEGLAIHYAKSDKDVKKIMNESVSVSKGDVTIYRDALSSDEQSDEARRTSQKVSYIRALRDPIVGAVPDSYKRWVIGRGVRYDFADDRAQKIVDDFWKENSMDIKLKKYYWRFIVESEWFTLLFIDRVSGKVKVREIPPREITNVETNPDDKEDYFSYERTFYNKNTRNAHTKYYPDINYYDTIDSKFVNNQSKYRNHKDWQGKDKLVHFVKLMDNREVRGRVFFERFLNWAEWYKDWVIDRAIINHEKGRVVWILTLKGRKINKNWKKFTSAPAGGTVKVETPNREWKPVSADIRADNVKEDGLFLLYQICAATALPLHILSQRTDQQVYSSIRKSETSFSMSILDKQYSLSEEYLKPLFRKVIQVAIESNNYNIPTHIDITSKVSEGIRQSYKSVLDNYKNKKLSEDEFIRDVKSLVSESKSDLKRNNSHPESVNKMLKEADSLEKRCNKGYVELLESDFNKNKPSNFTRILKESYEFFEEGVKTRIKTENCPVHIEYPDLVKEDFLDMAKVLRIYDENNIASKHTIRKKAGLNPDEERMKIEQERLEYQDNYGDDSQSTPDTRVDNNVDNDDVDQSTDDSV